MSADHAGVAVGSARSVQVSYQRRTASGDAVRLDPRPGRVAGRERLLAGVRARLEAAPGVGAVALAGLGGVGKTTVALEYAYRHLAEYRVVWFFHAESATGLLEQFHDLAGLLDAEPGGDVVAGVHAALAAHPGPWLLVLDNLRDHAAARRWLPAKGNGHVLVTTQDGHWPEDQAVAVSTISLDAAAQILLDRTASPDVASGRAVAAELGLLPLALAQAAGFMESTGRSIAEYLSLLRSDRAGLLARGAPAAHAVPVVATWSLALGELEAGSAGSVTLLRIAAFLAPEDVPFRLLLADGAALDRAGLDAGVVARVRALCGGGLALDDAVAGLRRHSLIGPPGRTFSVHRLVQEVTCDQLDADQQLAWRAVASALVEGAVPADTEQRAAWESCRLLLPHARIVADPLGLPMWRLAESLGFSGDYAAARAQWQSLADAYAKGLGSESPGTLAARANIARWVGATGDAAAARELYTGLLPVCERVFGPEHPDTLTVRAQIARWMGVAGDAAAARELYFGLLPVYERVLGPEHPDTLNVRRNIARWTEEQE